MTPLRRGLWASLRESDTSAQRPLCLPVYPGWCICLPVYPGIYHPVHPGYTTMPCTTAPLATCCTRCGACSVTEPWALF